MKLNKKGFMMAEVIVVSSVVLIVLTTLYISYNKIFSLYETRLKYEDSNLLYALSFYRDYLVESPDDNYTNKLSSAHHYLKSNNRYDMLLTYGSYDNVSYLNNTRLDSNNEFIDDVFLIHNNGLKTLNKDRLGGDVLYNDYVDYLSTSVDFTGVDFIMILQRKYNNNHNEKFAYLALDQ